MLAMLLITLGVLSRFIIHIQNFTPILAIALFAGFYMSKRKAMLIPLAIMAVSDIFVGLHATMIFTWGSILLISMMGIKAGEDRRGSTGVLFSFGSALLFYIVTNFGVWLTYNMYPKNVTGLLECYMAGIPYFRGTLASTLIYTGVLFGAYEFLAAKLKNTRFAHVL